MGVAVAPGRKNMQLFKSQSVSLTVQPMEPFNSGLWKEPRVPRESQT